MIEFKMDSKEMVFENEKYSTRMEVVNKGEGQLTGHGVRLRCYVMFSVLVRETGKEFNSKMNMYWDAKYHKSHFIFTGGSLKNFIEDQEIAWNEFKEGYWDKVKRLSTNIFTDEEIIEYKK